MRKMLALVVSALVLAGCGGGLGTVFDTLLRINHAAQVANLVDVYIFRRDQNVADDLITAIPITTRLAP
jgi:ABC-type glycerol-3-phosphate transport system substrate-binding protein